MAVLRVLGKTGDEETPFDRRRFARAREEFEKNLANGMLAFTVDPKTGEGDKQIKKFDPEAEEIIMTRQFVGG